MTIYCLGRSLFKLKLHWRLPGGDYNENEWMQMSYNLESTAERGLSAISRRARLAMIRNTMKLILKLSVNSELSTEITRCATG